MLTIPDKVTISCHKDDEPAPKVITCGCDATNTIQTVSNQVGILKKNSGNNYIIPLYEFSKNALLGDYSHYSPNNSLALNVFDIFNPDPNEHFLTPILLSFLKKPNKLFNNESFCDANIIINELWFLVSNALLIKIGV